VQTAALLHLLAANFQGHYKPQIPEYSEHLKAKNNELGFFMNCDQCTEMLRVKTYRIVKVFLDLGPLG
jgi:hypothetical protein